MIHKMKHFIKMYMRRPEKGKRRAVPQIFFLTSWNKYDLAIDRR